ncbi:DUF4907 domain-containing protein [Sediminicola luteus]|uniref:DUF4907 domain-containing protein n=1 Tax=Sediminicola luteus TaxID=319238 RepID=A0A2A4G1T5_9FLAO|nr:DUF4907 domain-containing protein [Sediminicola luteus]PCE62647.1 hypothetical protein B7P33_18615 [Sediminicola luteus]
MMKMTNVQLFLGGGLLLLTILLVFRGFNRHEEQGPVSPFTHEVIRKASGYGYIIYHNDKVLIKQEYIPVISGKNKFPNRSSAKKTAQLVVRKLELGIDPRVSLEELSLLGVKAPKR